MQLLFVLKIVTVRHSIQIGKWEKKKKYVTQILSKKFSYVFHILTRKINRRILFRTQSFTLKTILSATNFPFVLKFFYFIIESLNEIFSFLFKKGKTNNCFFLILFFKVFVLSFNWYNPFHSFTSSNMPFPRLKKLPVATFPSKIREKHQIMS